jgi:hypothetical protein
MSEPCLVCLEDAPPGDSYHLQEDFCQLGELSPKQKYEGSAELCAELADLIEPAARLVERSRLPAGMQERYVALLRNRSATLERAAQGHRRSRS